MPRVDCFPSVMNVFDPIPLGFNSVLSDARRDPKRPLWFPLKPNTILIITVKSIRMTLKAIWFSAHGRVCVKEREMCV